MKPTGVTGHTLFSKDVDVSEDKTAAFPTTKYQFERETTPGSSILPFFVLFVSINVARLGFCF